MKAAVVRDAGQIPGFEPFAFPAPGEASVVTVLATALSPRVRSGASGQHYTSRKVFPLVPGLDGVGQLSDGRRVYFLAANDTVGTMAEQALADPQLSLDLPPNVSASVVAAAMIPALSSWVALTRRAELQRGESVCVLGATGTAGQLAVQIAKHLGAGRVVAVGRDGDALRRVSELGADSAIRLTGGPADGATVAALASEVDIVLDYLWGTVTTAVMPALCSRREAETRLLQWVLIGSAAGDAIALSSVLLRKRNLRILGSGQGAISTADMFAASADVVAAIADGKLQVRAREVPLEDVARYWSAPLPSGERWVFVTEQERAARAAGAA